MQAVKLHSEAVELQFRNLMEGTYKKVFNLAYRLSGDRSDAEDLTQEAFFRAYRRFESYEGDRPFENWIYRIVSRLFLDLKRARSRRIRAISSDAPLKGDGMDDFVQFESADSRPNPEEQLLDSILDEDLQASLEQLKPDQRELIYLADIQGVSYSDIAERYDTPVGTVRSRLHRAHKQLRKILAARQKALKDTAPTTDQIG